MDSKTMVVGEVVKLPNVVLVNFSNSENMAVVARHLEENNVKVIEQPLDLKSLEETGYTVLSLVALSEDINNEIEVLADNNSIASLKPKSNREEKAVIVLNLYLKSGVLRVKAIDSGFKEGEKALQRHFNISEPIFKPKNAIQQFNQRVNDFRHSETGRNIEQKAVEIARTSSKVAKNIASNASQIYTEVMGDSDQVAQKQAQDEAKHFKPLELEKMQSVPFKNAVPAIKNLHIGLGWFYRSKL